MRISSLLLAASVSLAMSGAALANDLKPVQYQGIDLGDVAGDAYYTVERDGFHVVATFAPRGAENTPVRFEAVLARGQGVTFSTPRAVGEPPVSVSLKRQDDRVVVVSAALTN